MTLATQATAGLLVSVRSSEEALAALDGGADLIDIKEPRLGSLGAAEPAVAEAVLDAVAGRTPVSMALGELRDEPVAAVAGLKFAKLGLAGCGADERWVERLRAASDRFPAGVSTVAVVYADWQAAEAPCPDDVLSGARQLDLDYLLIDTFDKTAGNLLDYWPEASLSQFVAMVRGAGLSIVLAGSLSAEAIPRVARLGPDFVAVRTAACRGGRNGLVCRDRVRQLRELLAVGAKFA